MGGIFSKAAGDAAGMLAGLAAVACAVRDDVRASARRRILSILSEADVVTRDEFEVVREVAMAAREATLRTAHDGEPNFSDRSDPDDSAERRADDA